MSTQSYIERNRDYVTASKLKTFIKSPEAYYLEYIKEVKLEKEDSNAFILGTAFDDHLTYGPEAFAEKYFLDKGLTVDEMLVECEAQGIILTGKEKKSDFTKLLYGNVESKIRLTATQSIQLAGMLHEANRQPLWDLNGTYEKQVKIEGMYKGLKLRGTLDRLDLEKKMIRDWKTTANLKNFTFELASKYGYDTSMAFYFALVKMIKGVDCDVILDVVQSTGNYQSEVFIYQKEKMDHVLVETIFPALDKLATMTTEWLETGDEAVWMVETGERYQLFDLATYPMLESGKQKVISYI